MNHINEIRIMELALHNNLELSSDERTHLDGCDMCQATLNEERQLTANLGNLAPLSLPPQFLEGTVSQFQGAHRTFYHLPVLVAALLSILTGGLIVALIGFNYTSAITTIVREVADLFTLGKVLLNLAGSLPYTVQLAEFSIVASLLMGLTSLALGRIRAHTEITTPLRRSKG